MKTREFVSGIPMLALGALIACSTASSMVEAAEKGSAKEVARKVDETGTAIKNYTVQQKDEAVKQAKSALDDADARIHRLERKLDADWDKMDAAARKKARATLDTLRKERDDLGEWYGGLKHSSAESWDQVKDGFAKSYDVLKESFAKARKEF